MMKQTEDTTRRSTDLSLSEEKILESRISELGSRLCNSLNEILDAVSGSSRRPTQVSKTLGVNKVLASRTLQAAREADPLAAAHAMPGPEALRILLKAASKQKVDQSLIQSTEQTITEFDVLLRETLGGRAGLDALLATWLPDTRKRFEMGHKQAAFKANCGIKGVMAETVVNTAILYPSSDPMRCDGIFLHSMIGLRRLRPDATLMFTTHCATPEPNDYTWTTLNGTPIDSSGANMLLPEFCSKPVPLLDIEIHGNLATHIIKTPSLGVNGAVNLVSAEVFRHHLPRYAPPGVTRRNGPAADVEQPTRYLVTDVLIHNDVWQGSTPELRIFDTVLRGRGNPNDPGRNFARLRLDESIQHLGTGTNQFRITGMPEYVDILQHALDSLSWDSNQLRGYRCRIEYPFYGSEVFMGFIPPPPPESLSKQ